MAEEKLCRNGGKDCDSEFLCDQCLTDSIDNDDSAIDRQEARQEAYD